MRRTKGTPAQPFAVTRQQPGDGPDRGRLDHLIAGEIAPIALAMSPVAILCALEPIWKDRKIVLVSDAGGPFSNQPDEGLLKRGLRWTDIIDKGGPPASSCRSPIRSAATPSRGAPFSAGVP